MVNKVILLGRLGKDPEIFDSFCRLSLATSQVSIAKDGTKKEFTEWHKLVAFGKVARIIGDYLKKGSLVYVEGKLSTSSYEAKDGGKRYSTEIIIDVVKFLDGKTAEVDNAPLNTKAGEPIDGPEDDLPF